MDLSKIKINMTLHVLCTQFIANNNHTSKCKNCMRSTNILSTGVCFYKMCAITHFGVYCQEKELDRLTINVWTWNRR